jgi:hypothetical protein
MRRQRRGRPCILSWQVRGLRWRAGGRQGLAAAAVWPMAEQGADTAKSVPSHPPSVAAAACAVGLLAYSPALFSFRSRLPAACMEEALAAHEVMGASERHHVVLPSFPNYKVGGWASGGGRWVGSS